MDLSGRPETEEKTINFLLFNLILFVKIKELEIDLIISIMNKIFESFEKQTKATNKRHIKIKKMT